jgi:BirA family biotin operon repressor/biotin-[acetyl-CoA-carboxylase] ligase
VTNPAHDDLAELDALLTTERLGRVHEHHAELGSTNDRALAWLSDGDAPDGTLVTADAQTAGRGRRGRPWSSPPGRDIYASVILRPGLPTEGFGSLALAVGVGLREGLLRVFGDGLSDLVLKWPNDLLIGRGGERRKLAGILCESRWRGREVELVVGFGVNVHRRADEFPPELRGVATSLAEQLDDADRRGRAEILAALLYELERSLDRFFAGGFAAIRSRYEPHCVVLGREIEIGTEAGGGRQTATAVGLDEDGALLVSVRGGPPARLQSADVWLA